MLVEIQKNQIKPNDLESYFDRLWPILRSITGEGFRKSLRILQEILPYEIESIASGTSVFDWTVPQEWKITEAFIANKEGEKVIDIKNNNLHVLNYSTAVDRLVKLEDLQEHLYSLEDLPEAIPYVTSYYQRRWGFCLSHNQRIQLCDEEYLVKIEAEHFDGQLNWGHKVIPATNSSKKEFLLSSYLCHPSMANNELSGPILLSFLGKLISQLPERNFNYRLMIVPETIGSISYLSKYGEEIKDNCVGGLVATCVADEHAWNYKRSKQGDSAIDKICMNLMNFSGLKNYKIHDFFPTGSDERQFCSPAFDLPVGSITRSMYTHYKEYHTSLDNKDFISFEAFQESIEFYMKVILCFESFGKYENLNPHCEPMLGKRNLYHSIGAANKTKLSQNAFLYLLSFSDGKHDLVDIANKMKISLYELLPFIKALVDAKLLKKIEE
ncbi:MAG: DUF4910 domain-containing protein [Bdellovibrionota bacterium]